MTELLSGCRVIDLAYNAPLAGRILAQLGAEVVLVEPPGGLPHRTREPLLETSNGQQSAAWFPFSVGKKSVTLDWSNSVELETFRATCGTADILLESFSPGEQTAEIAECQAIRNRFPHLIHASITPFGSDGPKSNWQATDLTLWAAGGPLFPNRDTSGSNHAPLRISSDQAWLHAACDAVVGVLIAYIARSQIHQGQHVDVSVQQSLTQSTLSAIVAHAIRHENFSFLGPTSEAKGKKKSLDLSGSGSRTRQSKWQVKDGLIEMHLSMGPTAGGKSNRLFKWMKDEESLPAKFHDWDWVTLPQKIEDEVVTFEDLAEARQSVAAFLINYNKSDIVDMALNSGLLMAPIYTTEDLLRSPHHKAREFFQTVDGVTLPGDFAKGLGDLTPPKSTPRIGEHNSEVLRNPEQISPPPEPLECPPRLPLEGLKIVDLAWVVAGPAIGRVLADYGAEVVRVESSTRLDTARVIGPFPDGKLDPQRSALFDNCNTGKLGLSLDLRTSEGQSVVRDLVEWGDVLIESFSPGQMERWNLGYAELEKINPSLLMLSTSLMGQSGPFAKFAGYGNVGAAMSGYQYIVGWPESRPIGPFGPYTDFVGPRFGLIALLAAIIEWTNNKNGRHIDVSQAEGGIQFLSTEIALTDNKGRVADAQGNRVSNMCPHGVFPCHGDDRWIAIAIRHDEDWRKLAQLIGGAALNETYNTFEGRKSDEENVESIVSDWTTDKEFYRLQEELQQLGLAAHIVSSTADIVEDPQLISRDHFVRLERKPGDESVIEASRFRLSETQPNYSCPAPTIGRDNDYVLREILKYDDALIELLQSSGSLV